MPNKKSFVIYMILFVYIANAEKEVTVYAENKKIINDIYFQSKKLIDSVAENSKIGNL